MRSGRVQFAGVPLSREASALQRLHQTLVKYFDHLELHDRVSERVCFSVFFYDIATNSSAGVVETRLCKLRGAYVRHARRACLFYFQLSVVWSLRTKPMICLAAVLYAFW